MSTALETLQEAKKAYEDAKEKLGKDAIRALFKDLFAMFPTMTAVEWAQYTPYFNDGDPCIFHVNDPYFRFLDTEEDTYMWDLPSSWNIYSMEDAPELPMVVAKKWNWQTKQYEEHMVPAKVPVPKAGYSEAQAQSAHEFVRTFFEMEEIFLEVIGDHAMVTARPVDGGIELDVESYDHD